MKQIFADFKNFAVKGNVIDLAVAVIIGNAFGKVVTALVEKVMMPPVGYIIGGVDFSRLRLVMQLPGPGGREEVAIYYGEFLQAGFNFLIIAWCMFMVFKVMKSLNLTSTPATPEDVLLLREIRDLLKK